MKASQVQLHFKPDEMMVLHQIHPTEGKQFGSEDPLFSTVIKMRNRGVLVQHGANTMQFFLQDPFLNAAVLVQQTGLPLADLIPTMKGRGLESLVGSLLPDYLHELNFTSLVSVRLLLP
jgi:hypothetical protein